MILRRAKPPGDSNACPSLTATHLGNEPIWGFKALDKSLESSQLQLQVLPPRLDFNNSLKLLLRDSNLAEVAKRVCYFRSSHLLC